GRELITTAALVGSIMCILALFTFWWYGFGIKAQTMAFTLLAVMQLFNAQNCRSEKSLFSIGLLKNRKLVWAILISFLLQLAVVYLPPLQVAFHTTALSRMEWGWIFLMASTVVVAMEIKKMLARKAGSGAQEGQ
ncbi:MAG: cation-translocating P-type ATPase C-terminal domain-containing protein, partial [archaeon]